MQMTEQFLSDEEQARFKEKFLTELEEERFEDRQARFRDELRKLSEREDQRRHAQRFAKTAR